MFQAIINQLKSKQRFSRIFMITLTKRTFEYLTSDTMKAVNNPSATNVSTALIELEKTFFANISSIALAEFKAFVLPFLLKNNYKLQDGELYCLSLVDLDFDNQELQKIKEIIKTKSNYSKADTLGSMMPNFNPLAKGKAVENATGTIVNVIGFELFDAPCPSNWIGGFKIRYANQSCTGWLRPNQLTFN